VEDLKSFLLIYLGEDGKIILNKIDEIRKLK